MNYQLQETPVEIYQCKPLEVLQPITTTDDTQRTKEWFEQRKGRFTGSKISELMKCTASSKKYEWGRPEKAIDFSEAAMKYIYSKAKEKQRNKVIKTATSQAMSYGANNEKAVKEMLVKMYPEWQFEDCGFIEFIKDVAGSSPDGEIITEIKRIGLEIKCSTDWNGVYDRHEELFDQSHQDFWQINSEMLSLQVDEVMYVVAEPSESIFEPNITDLSINHVFRSITHQEAILHRSLIGKKAINLFLNGAPFRSAIQQAITDYDFVLPEDLTKLIS